MKKKNCGVFLFVKTPGLSPVKTRLAKGIGQDLALEFYHWSIGELHRALDELEDIQLVYAVAERLDPLVRSHWGNQEFIEQGEGELGDRLWNVYCQALTSYHTVVLIGADCPFISKEFFLRAIHSSTDFCLGPAEDGGYYLFSGKKELSRDAFLRVPYSSKSTFDEFSKQLKLRGSLETLPRLRDVDDREDLEILGLSQFFR